MVAVKRSKPWTMTEIKFVVEKYPFTDTRSIAEQLGRKAADIKTMASRQGVSKNSRDSGEYTHGLFKTERVLKLIKMLHKSPCLMSDVQDELGVLKRTAYRYISLLISSGIKVEREGNHYFISRKNCPLCGTTTNNTLR